MTDQEKLSIIALRNAGLTYQAIADETGISLGSIKMFFMRGSPVPLCEQCHKPLRQDLVRKNRRFCSDVCRVQWWTEHPKRTSCCTCKHCGKQFYSRKPRTYCSRSCFYADRKGGDPHE